MWSFSVRLSRNWPFHLNHNGMLEIEFSLEADFVPRHGSLKLAVNHHALEMTGQQMNWKSNLF